ncbi:FHA domain-containing protein [Bifidobacterium bohemicum]|uniref:FHA domain protein n=2 Tax=Bifidobacterium bohemicum TaxID=638617 RepID=A0A086ZE80_9BIFI|nr:FHA domain protein [Bifidobacterium bohemicum DSM 22767]SCB94963.1 FHA domain-containing protein [Bifidobacterium bohemicum]
MGAQSVQRWVIKANNAIECAVSRGQSVEIGRRPLRPLTGNRHKRVDIDDPTRSMSKRHVLFSVSDTGSATIRDLGSTNGTYLVADDGGLRRLERMRDYPLGDSPIRVQLGDVPIDFVEVVEDQTDRPPVADLFEYAKGRSNAEPEMGEMSVDDILDLRAGEPTASINSADVAERIKKLVEAQNAKVRSHVNSSDDNAADAGRDKHEAGAAVQRQDPDAAEHDAVAKDDDADDRQSPPATDALDAHASQVTVEANADRQTVSLDRSVRDESDASEPTEEASAFEGLSLGVVGTAPVMPSKPRDLFRDAFTGDAISAVQPTADSPVSDDSPSAFHDVTPAVTQTGGANMSAAGPVTGAISPDGKGAVQNSEAVSGSSDHPVAAKEVPTGGAISSFMEHREQVVFVPMDQQTGRSVPDQNDGISPYDRFMKPQEAEVDQDDLQQNPVGAEQNQTGAFTPAFEPGSVFEKVSKGQFDRVDTAQSVEAGGFTSDDAQRSDDFSKQFQMAGYPELQAFLAMNPNLYDDLYAWLSALGNQDVDAALERNSGYARYRERAGKGRRS